MKNAIKIETTLLVVSENQDTYYNDGMLRFAEVMRWQHGQTFESWAEHLMGHLIPYIKGLEGTLYYAHSQQNTVKLHFLASYASQNFNPPLEVEEGFLTIGQVAKSKEWIITHTHQNTLLSYGILAQIPIHTIATIPIMYNEQLCGVLEVFFHKEPLPMHLEFLKRLNISIAANMNIWLKEKELNQRNEELQKAMEHLKTAQSHLVQAEKMSSVGQLTAGIAHEINNPINFVYAGSGTLRTMFSEICEVLDLYKEIENIDSIDALKEKIKEVKKLKKELHYEELIEDMAATIKDIREGANRTAEIVKGLRNFSRLDEEQIKVANIHELIESTLVLLKTQWNKNIELIKEYDNALPSIGCYPGKLGQVFMNILSNAIQAIEGDGKIRIKTTMHKDFFQIRIKDSGTGMPEEVKKRIFEPFFTTKDVGKGTGLGLSVTYGIIEKHKGKIEVESEIGKGTEFIISIPVSLG